jgi:hypothetical protein
LPGDKKVLHLKPQQWSESKGQLGPSKRAPTGQIWSNVNK